MNVHTGAPTRPATSSSLSGVVTSRMSASIRSVRISCQAGRMRSSGGQAGWRTSSAASVGVSGHRVERRETGITRTTKDDRADGDLDGVQLLLEVAHAAASEEQEERAHVLDASSPADV